MELLLDVRDLRVEFDTRSGMLRVLDNVSFQLDAGGSFGLVGESGCGKSTTGYSLMNLLPSNGRISGGRIFLEGTDVLGLPDSELRRVRWQKIAMVFQNCMSALNPVMRIGDQIADALQQHVGISRKEALDRAAAAFERVGLRGDRLMHYPHEFSGGMKQRAMLALALICGPKLLIADEPTTALDVVAQRQILQLLNGLQKELHLGLILISHDISIVSELCRHVAVMYAGQIIEYGPADEVLFHCRHPYTWALINSVPSLFRPRSTLTSLPGSAPRLHDRPPGCRFAPRCTHAQSLCGIEDPPPLNVGPMQVARCHFALDLDLGVQEGQALPCH